MAILSFVLAVLALLLSLGGVVASAAAVAGVKWLGLVVSGLAVATSVAGVVTGSVAHGRAKRDGRETTFAVVAIVTNVFVFLASLCVLGTCGACSALVSKEGLTQTAVVPSPDGGLEFRVTLPDGAVRYEPIPEDQQWRFRGMPGPTGTDPGVSPTPDPAAPPVPDPSAPAAPAPAAPTGQPIAPAAPGDAPALPPPPIREGR